MSFIGWLIFGLLVGGALVVFWQSIREWLSTTVCNWVEANFGYSTRQALMKAIVTVDRVMTGVRRTAQLFTKNRSMVYVDNVSFESIDEKAREELLKGNVLVQEIAFEN